MVYVIHCGDIKCQAATVGEPEFKDLLEDDGKYRNLFFLKSARLIWHWIDDEETEQDHWDLPGTLFKKQMLEDEAKLHKRDWTEDISKWEQRQPDYIWDQKKIADCPSKRPSRGSEETGRAFFSNDGEHR
eukprot:GHVS01053427.1.p1 GENE.GHVS01053427.1~~GHVS01053427.1.p1  ORF type:complete len:130 (+),score=20.92 GHVS01053427.1:407-796(+)